MTAPTRQSLSRPERRGDSGRSIIEAAKEIPLIDFVGRLAGPGKMRKVGGKSVTNCVLPDHQDRSPSFNVNSEKDLWYCHGCLRGGDIVELARYVWDYSKDEVPMAAADLLHEFGCEIPERPRSWYAKQERQRDTRAAIEQARKNIWRRRLFKYLVLPLLAGIEDEEEFNQELERAWSDFQEMLP